MSFKIVVSEPKSRKAWQIEKEVPELIGKKIGDQISGSLIGLNGFSLEITGGSDKDGFPMRYDLPGIERKKILLSKGPGMTKAKRKGMRKRKNVRGNTISVNIMQINLKILEGEGDVPTILGIQPKVKEGEAKEGEVATEAAPAPTEAPKEETPKAEEVVEVKAEEKKEKAPVEQKKNQKLKKRKKAVNNFEKEIEIKFRVDDKLGSKLRNLNLEPHEETDEYFFSTENVGKDLYLRFRKKNGKTILTLKNVIIGGADIDIYESEETSMELTEEQYEKMKSIFNTVFPIKLEVKKTRKKGKYKECIICHDFVEGLGEFFEIEGSREKINELRKEFEIDDSLVDREKGYVVMTLKNMGLL